MKKNYNIARIVGIALTLVFCFSTLAFSEDSYISLLGSTDGLNQVLYDYTTNTMPLKERSYEIDVKEQRNPGKPDIKRSLFSVRLDINIPSLDKGGIYIKVTDPNGIVILDKSTPEKGFASREKNEYLLVEGEDLPEGYVFVPGKYAIWLMPTEADKIAAVTVILTGFPRNQ